MAVRTTSADPGSESDGDGIRVEQLGPRTFLLTPPRQLDQNGAAGLSELVASLAEAAPQVVLDLSQIETIERDALTLLPRLGALLRRAGGQLVAAFPSGQGEGLLFRAVEGAADDEVSRLAALPARIRILR